MKQTNVKAYKSDGFIGRYQQLVRDTVIPYQYSVLCDEAEDTEKSHVIANFANAAKALAGEDTGDGFYGMVFQDSDAAKWIEAAAYSLANFPDRALEERADSLIDLIAAAQDKDGYLNTYYTCKDTDKRWTNLLEGHELYCSGHMIEAAVAYAEATGKDKLLRVMTRNMEHIYDHFIVKGCEGFPGHPEIELALMKMYRATGNEHALELARTFIDRRGTDPDFFRKERESRDWTVWGSDGKDPDYQQSGRPVREQTEATGHAVRAVYLYTGMADLIDTDDTLRPACETLWDNITNRRMYITGGIGSTVLGEAFTADYDLPSDTAYCETCASIGLMFFASAMLRHDADRKYSDVMERAFYNTVLAGMQLDGKRFFYVNPLECDPGISGKAPTHRHVVTTRPKWYACACCPPNAARLIMSFGKYAYSEDDTAVYAHMYAGGKVIFDNGCELICRTSYPDDMTVRYTVVRAGNARRIAVRIPGWSEAFSLSVGGKTITALDKGYAYADISDGTEICLTLDGTPRFNFASPRIPHIAGMTALSRGPLVYCFEGTDNGNVSALTLDTAVTPQIKGNDASLGGASVIECAAVRDEDTDIPYSFTQSSAPASARAIPYYTWCNRGETQMRVWMRKK
ncbi:MAG: glycoside hydrolase family 127 protein [Oscillospiraceae bacterium]|nr:glycoside hydrolase family 127 protein [Oscillospiraceae bacterium]